MYKAKNQAGCDDNERKAKEEFPSYPPQLIEQGVGMGGADGA